MEKPISLTQKESQLLEEVALKARELKFKWVLVGGWVRDKLLGLESSDLDLVVFGGPRNPEEWPLKLAHSLDEKIIEPYGKSKVALVVKNGLSIEIQASKRPLSTPGSYEFGVSLLDDSLYRDLKLNALYYDYESQQVLDYQGGLKDIQERKLSLTGDHGQNLFHDPIRILRILRFQHKLAALGFSLERSTRESLKQYSHLLRPNNDGGHPLCHPERIWQELDKVLSSSRAPTSFFIHLKKFNLIDEIFPRPPGPYDWDMDQKNPYHHLNLWHHTMMTVHGLFHLIKQKNYSHEDRVALLLAAFFHDIGKLDKEGGYVQAREGGERSFHGHAQGSARQAETILNRLGLYGENRLKKKVVALVKDHLFPHQLDPENKKSLRKFLRHWGKDYQLLLDLSWADRRSHSKEHRDLQQLAELQKNLASMDLEEILQMKPLLSGHEILQVASEHYPNLRTGPWMGRLHRELLEKQLSLEIHSKDEAMKWVQEQMKDLFNLNQEN